MINEIIDCLNECFCGVHATEKIMGVAQSIFRIGSDDEVDFMPGIVGDDGEIKYAGIDDIDSIQIYHKSNNASLSISNQNKGYGDTWVSQDTFNMSLIVAFDTKKVKKVNLDILLMLRSRFPQQIQDVKNIKQVVINPSSAILNSKQIFESEYSIGKNQLLPEYINFMQINYSIQLLYDQQCIDKCINC